MTIVPAWNQSRIFHLPDVTRFAEEQFVNEHLFDGDGFYGRLLCFQHGQHVPEHLHEHQDECFDVLEGEGTFLLDGQEVRAGPGTTLYVAARTRHGLRADGSARWVLRETVHHRVYARRALHLVGRTALKRLPVVGERWR